MELIWSLAAQLAVVAGALQRSSRRPEGRRAAAPSPRGAQAEPGEPGRDELLQTHGGAADDAEVDLDQRPDSEDAFLVGKVGGRLEGFDIGGASD